MERLADYRERLEQTTGCNNIRADKEKTFTFVQSYHGLILNSYI